MRIWKNCTTGCQWLSKQILLRFLRVSANSGFNNFFHKWLCIIENPITTACPQAKHWLWKEVLQVTCSFWYPCANKTFTLSVTLTHLGKAVGEKSHCCGKWCEEGCFACCTYGMQHAWFQTSCTVCLTESIDKDKDIIHSNTDNDECWNATKNAKTWDLKHMTEKEISHEKRSYNTDNSEKS